jgi:hypothetical protein
VLRRHALRRLKETNNAGDVFNSENTQAEANEQNKQ